MFDKVVRAIFAFFFICLAGPLIPLVFVSWYYKENIMVMYPLFMMGGVFVTVPVGLGCVISIMNYNKIRWPALILPTFLFFPLVAFSSSLFGLAYFILAIISVIIIGWPIKWFCDVPAKKNCPLSPAVDALIKNSPAEK